MENTKRIILNNLCYTELVYERINKKLGTQKNKDEIEQMIMNIIVDKNCEVTKKGKNFYLVCGDFQITINSTTFRVITMDRMIFR